MSDRRPAFADLPGLREQVDAKRREYEEARGAYERAKSAWYSAEDRLHDALDRLSICASWGCDRDRDEDGVLCPDCRMEAAAVPEPPPEESPA